MESDTFRHAINNGLGWVILHLRSKLWKPYTSAIEYVCTHNTAFDAQCEGSRARYVFDIVGLTDDIPHFEAVVRDGLMNVDGHWDTDHLFDLAVLFAQAGHMRVREAMYSRFHRHDTHEPYMGGIQIVRMDGMAGLLFVAEQIGEHLSLHPDAWVDDGLLAESKTVLGVDPAPELRQAAASNIAVKRFLDSAEEYRANAQRRSTPDYQKWSYEQLRDAIHAKKGDVPSGWLSGWGRRASDEAVRQAAVALTRESDEKCLLAYVTVFTLREFPLDPERIVQLVRSGDQQQRRVGGNALRHVRHERVRTLALELAEQEEKWPDSIRLFARNFVGGDERRIEEFLRRRTDEDSFHSAGYDALKVFEMNPGVDAGPTMSTIYELDRCSLCRRGAVKNLMEGHRIPEWMLEECRHDSYEETRELANSYSGAAL